jgi:hypothetical protein
MKADLTFNAPSNPNPFRKPHRRTGRPTGAPKENRNRWVHGRRSADYVKGRKALNALLRRAREAVAQAAE